MARQTRKTVVKRGVSRFLNQAARDKLQQTRIMALLDEMDAKHGWPDAVAEAEAERRIPRVEGVQVIGV